jgi:hypothetical protein
MNDVPIAQRAYIAAGNSKNLRRWRIEGHNGLFRFRVMPGKNQHPFEGEVLAKFKTHDEAGYSKGYFSPDDGVIPILKIPVEKTVIQGKTYFRVSWGSGWQCIPGEEWTDEVEKEARKVLKDRRITELEFEFVTG